MAVAALGGFALIGYQGLFITMLAEMAGPRRVGAGQEGFEQRPVVEDLLLLRELAVDVVPERFHRPAGLQALKPFLEEQEPLVDQTPELGEHTDEVLAEFGFSKDEISKLRADKTL